VGSNPVQNIDQFGLEYGAAYAATARADGWRPPGLAGTVRPEVKAYLCRLMEECSGDLKCVFRRTNEDRKQNRPQSWYNARYREAENWAYAAGWSVWQTSALAIGAWQIHTYLPMTKTTPPSADAWTAGLEGRNHQGSTPAELKKWCSGCN
jgi:hypothetical protein